MTRDASKRLISATQMSPVTESQLASGSDGIVDHQPSAANTTFAAVRFEHIKHLNIDAPPPTAAATVTHADSA